MLSNNYLTIFTLPEENNCFSIITQVIIRATSFSLSLFALPLETCFSIIITSRGVIIARYNVILNQSACANLYNHLVSNYTNIE